MPFPTLSPYVEEHDYRSISSASPIAASYHPVSPNCSQTSDYRSHTRTSTTRPSRIPPNAPPRPLYGWDKQHPLHTQPFQPVENIIHAYWSLCKSGACDHLFHASVTLPPRSASSSPSSTQQLPHRDSDSLSPRAYHQRQVSAYCEDIDRQLDHLANTKIETSSPRERPERPEWIDAEPKVAVPRLKVMKRAARSSDASGCGTPVKVRVPRAPLQENSSSENVGAGLGYGRHGKGESAENVAPMLGGTMRGWGPIGWAKGEPVDLL